MKELKYRGYTFLYKVCDYSTDGMYTSFETIFYSHQTYIKHIKKYYLFGPIIKKSYHKKLFTLYYNIEDVHYTKEWNEKKLDRQIGLLNRKEEIKNGEIV